MPTLVGGKALGGKSDLCCHAELEFVVRNLEEGKKLANKQADVLSVDECVGELQCTPPDRDITVPQTVEDSVPVSLNGGGVDGYNLVQSIQRDIAISISVSHRRSDT